LIITILKVLLIGLFGVAILILIPDLFLPISDAIDSALNTEFTTVMQNIYAVLPEGIMTLMIMQFSTIAIVILIRFIFGAKK